MMNKIKDLTNRLISTSHNQNKSIQKKSKTKSFIYNNIEILMDLSDADETIVIKNINLAFKNSSKREIETFTTLYNFARNNKIKIYATDLFAVYGSYYFEENKIELSFSNFTNKTMTLAFINHVFSHELGHFLDKQEYKDTKKDFFISEINAWKLGFPLIAGNEGPEYKIQVKEHLTDLVEELGLSEKNNKLIELFLKSIKKNELL